MDTRVIPSSASPDASAYCAMAKRFATDAGFRICCEAQQLFGGYGYIKEYPLERYGNDSVTLSSVLSNICQKAGMAPTSIVRLNQFIRSPCV